MMRLHREIFAICSTFLTGLFLLSPSLLAQEFIAPEQITKFGRTYKLAYTKIVPNGQAIYEYTANNESIENWTALVTFNYRKGFNIDPIKWTSALKASLDAHKPRPHYKLYATDKNGYARFIFEPDRSNLTYESNIHKSFHAEACGGLLVLQYAAKYPKDRDNLSSEKLSTLISIREENEKISVQMEHDDWVPACQ